jgi:hypothetical protein
MTAAFFDPSGTSLAVLLNSNARQGDFLCSGGLPCAWMVDARAWRAWWCMALHGEITLRAIAPLRADVFDAATVQSSIHSIHSFIQFNSIQFNSFIQYMCAQMCLTLRPWRCSARTPGAGCRGK